MPLVLALIRFIFCNTELRPRLSFNDSLSKVPSSHCLKKNGPFFLFRFFSSRIRPIRRPHLQALAWKERTRRRGQHLSVTHTAHPPSVRLRSAGITAQVKLKTGVQAGGLHTRRCVSALTARRGADTIS